MSMRTRALGTDELQVSVVGLGCNNFGRKGSKTEGLTGTDAVLGAAIDHGITLLDTAALYGGPESMSEQLMGRALKGGRRDQVILATKFGHSAGNLVGEESWGPKGSRGYIRKAVEGSLRRLQTDYIDLFQQHTPDPVTPIEETLEALAELVQEGKIRFFGHSNYDAELTREAAELAERKHLPRCVSAQNEYSLLRRGIEPDLMPALREAHVGLLPYFPLANGLLTGKYTKHNVPEGSRLALNQQRHADIIDAEWDTLERYRGFCAEQNLSMLEATFGWLLAQPEVSSVIAGATSVEQVAANASAGGVTLTADQTEEISAIFS